MRKLAVLVALLGSLFVVSTAQAVPPPASIFDGDVQCGQVTADGNVAGSTGQIWCGTLRNWSGVSGTIDDNGDGSITSTVNPALPSDARATVESFEGMQHWFAALMDDTFG